MQGGHGRQCGDQARQVRRVWLGVWAQGAPLDGVLQEEQDMPVARKARMCVVRSGGALGSGS